MKLTMRWLLVAVSLIVFSGCSLLRADNTLPLYQASSYYNYIQPSYSDYLKVTESWLRQHRSFISQDQSRELAMNMPFELGSSKDKAVLLVHGLGDSPYSFSDLAKSLAEQGFYVQTLLLPGHGSDPKDLQLPTYQDWQVFVDHYANLLKQDYQEVWLGGFSTGANLVTIHALESGDIDGLMLFSPGFQSKTPILERFAPLVSLFVDGYEAKEENLARYTSAPLQGAISYVDSAQKLRALLKQKQIDIPTLIAVSEADSVVDATAVKTMFSERFTNPNKQLIWYGDSEFEQSSITSYAMHLDSDKISTGSHMSPLFAPSNGYYGKNGERKMCMNSFSDEDVEQCKSGADTWYSAWGYTEKDKIHARLTWNPYYTQLEQAIAAISSTAQ